MNRRRRQTRWLLLSIATTSLVVILFLFGAINPLPSKPLSKNLPPSKPQYVSFIPLHSFGKRGWLLDPVAAAHNAGLTGGADTCKSVHVGEIKPRGIRGNHRHHVCNETFVIWGADTIFRFEKDGEKGYEEVRLGADEVIVAVSTKGRAHALINVDQTHSTYLLGCQDAMLTTPTESDFKVWKDLTVHSS